jgi:phosphoribosylformylglycinamidine synthase
LKLSIIVTLKKNVLDPQGKVIQQTLHNMGIRDVNSVRQGKFFEIEIDEKNYDIAKKKGEEICKKLLANLVIEEFKVINN